MDIQTLLIFAGMVFLASVINGVSGFGFGIVVLMVFPYIFGYTHAVAMAVMMATMLVCYNAYLYRKHINRTWILPWSLLCFVSDFFAVRFLKHLGDGPLMLRLLGCCFVLMAIYLLWGQKIIKVRASYTSMSVLAILSGLIQGVFGVGGPLMAAFFLIVCRSKEEYIGTLQMASVTTFGIDLIMRMLNGMIDATVLSYSTLGIVFILAGLFVAKKLVRHMSAALLKNIVCVLMLFSGIHMVV